MDPDGQFKIRIRTYDDADYEEVAQLWRNVKLTFPDGTIESLEDMRIVRERNPTTVLVAELGGHVVGTIIGTFDGRRGFISRLGVDPTKQHHGIGSQLFTEIVKRFKALGIKRAAGFVTKKNQSVLEFYKKFGAKPMDDTIPVSLNLRDT
jgi:ribosomal protein S18 acetylase RimI-like enzyme